jgi:hypothetical protein
MSTNGSRRLKSPTVISTVVDVDDDHVLAGRGDMPSARSKDVTIPAPMVSRTTSGLMTPPRVHPVVG